MSRRRAAAGLALALVAALACGSPSGHGPAPGTSLFADPFAVEVLVEAPNLAEPFSERPNRFFGGWIPRRVAGRRVLATAPGGGTIEIAVVEPGRRRSLALDLLHPRGAPRPAHVEVSVDDRPPLRVPVADPLLVPLPAGLAPGRHRVRIAVSGAGGRSISVAAGRVRGGSAGGAGRREEGALVQRAPSIVDVVAPPGPARRLTGELCRPASLRGGADFGLEVDSAAGAPLARWRPPAALLDRLRDRLGACRPIALSVPAAHGPVRVRLAAHGNGPPGTWRLAWTPAAAPGPEPPRDAPAVAGPPAAAAPPRLVVLYVMDALRADRVGALGGPDGVSPTYDRLAREGFLFRAHRSVAPNTLPSTRDLFTGRVFLTSRSWERVGTTLPTLAQVFRDAGYRTGLFTGNPYVSARFGLARGFEHVADDTFFDPQAGPPESAAAVNRNAEQVQASALAWLRSLPAGERAFLYLHTLHPHNPYAPPAPFARRFTAGIPSRIDGTTKTLLAVEKGRRATSAADRERLRGLYTASFAYNDAELGRFVAALRRRVPAQDIFLVLTADHGDELFDHGGALHGYTLYEELLHIPLVVWSPGRVRPGSTSATTDALDLHATLLDLLGRLPEPGKGPGRSLLPFLAGRSGPPASGLRFAGAPNTPGGFAMVRDGRWKLIRVAGTRRGWAMGRGPGRTWDRQYLFDLAADPGERRNLAGGDGVREQWLRSRLRTWVARHKALGRGVAAPAQEPPIDEETRRRLEALGYVD